LLVILAAQNLTDMRPLHHPTPLFIAGIFIICLAACKKDKDKDNSPTAREILTSSEWKFSEYKENGIVMPIAAACETDDYFTFSASNTYTRHRGSVKCDPSEAATFTDGWFLSAANDSLAILSEQRGQLLSISETSFTIRRNGANTFEYKYVKK
jgi:hypothetical protein